MRIKSQDLKQERHADEFFHLPKHMLHSSEYQHIGALETMAYTFMVHYALKNHDGSFTFLKKDNEAIKSLLNITDYHYQNIIKNLRLENILKENPDHFHLKNMYVPVDESPEEIFYYG